MAIKFAAESLSVTQPRVSDIVNGKIDKFTLDMLFSMLDKLGFRTEFTFSSLESAFIKIQTRDLAKVAHQRSLTNSIVQSILS